MLIFFRKSQNEEKRAQKLTFEEHCDHHMKQIPRATAVTAQPCQLTSDRTTNHYTFQSFKGIRDNLYIIVYKYHNYHKFCVTTSIQMYRGVGNIRTIGGLKVVRIFPTLSEYFPHCPNISNFVRINFFNKCDF